MSRTSDIARSLFRRTARAATPKAAARLGCEVLEGRIVPTPVVTVQKIADAQEGGADGVFRFTRTGDTSQALSVFLAGSRTAGPDDTDPLTGEVLFPAGHATTDLTVTAYADFEYDPGETVTLTIVADSSYDIGTPGSATVTLYDNAAHTFTLASNDGAVWYDVEWDQVDPAAATDTAALTDFTLVFAGQMFTPSTTSFTVSPTAEFEYGSLVDIKFTVEFASPVAGFEKLIVDNGLVTGVDAITHLPGTPFALQAKAPAAIVLDFNPMAFPQTGVDWTITASVGGTSAGSSTITIPQNGTPGLVRDAVKEVFKGFGLDVESTGNTGLIVRGPAGKHLTAAEIIANIGPVLPAGPSHITVKNAAPNEPTFSYRR